MMKKKRIEKGFRTDGIQSGKKVGSAGIEPAIFANELLDLRRSIAEAAQAALNDANEMNMKTAMDLLKDLAQWGA
jgi:hypothetical protein